MEGIACHVMRCHATQETKVKLNLRQCLATQITSDDVAGITTQLWWGGQMETARGAV